MVFRYDSTVNKLRPSATKLRQQGYSYSMISSELGVAKSTLSNWFRDIPFEPNETVLKRIQYGPIKAAARSHNKRVWEIKTLMRQGVSEIGRLSKRDLWLLGLGLYIGEGSKTIESVRIINSDSYIIKLAIKWLKEVCNLDDSNISIAMHIYPDTNTREAKRYWQHVTGLPDSSFRKTQIDRRQKREAKIGKLPYGTAHLVVVSNGDADKGVRLFRRITGWMDGVLKYQ